MERKAMIKELITETCLLEQAFYEGLSEAERSQVVSPKRWSVGDLQQAGELIGRMSQAMAGLDDSLEWQGVTHFNLACQFSLLGETDKAVAELQDTLEKAPSLVELSEEDSDLEPIRDSAGYRAVYERITAEE